MRFSIKNGGEEQTLSTNILPTYKWKHIAVTMGENGVTLYIDGEAVAHSDAIDIRPTDFHPVLNLVGCSQFTADPIFKGCIDDFRIYDYALSANEVAAIVAGTEGISEMTHQQHKVVKTEYYSPSGIRLSTPQHGLNIVKEYYEDGSVREYSVVR